MNPVLVAAGLSVGFGRQSVLSGVELRLLPGEKLALVGANGSGKSTLLRTLAGLLPPLAGELSWGGGPLASGAERVKTVGVLLQNESPGPFSVAQQVTMGLALDGPPPERERQVIELSLERNRLVELAARACDRLSGGEAQRVRWARAGVAQPSILLLDEPTNHLDPARRADLMHQLTQLPSHTAVILSTHDLSVAATCDRVALLHEGRVLVQGNTDEVLQPEPLSRALGVTIERRDDPQGGLPFFRAAVSASDVPEPSAQ